MWLTLVLATLAGLGLAVVAALAGAAPAAAASPTLEGRALSPAAGWHGRAVSAPAPTRVEGRRTPSGWAAGAVRRGDGRGLRGGSARVREVQRRLRALGYRPGRVNGVFGRRTQDAVGWFEYKHRLRVDGIVTVGTLHALRTAQELTPAERRAHRSAERRAQARAGARAKGAPRRAASTTATESGSTADRAEGTPASVADTVSGLGAWAWAALAAVVLTAIALVALLAGRGHGRGRASEDEGPVYELWVDGTSPDPAIGTFRGVVKAVSVPEDPKPAGWVSDSQYLVADPLKPQPFWAPARDIEQLGAAPQARGPAADADADGSALGYVAGESEQARAAATATIERTCTQRGVRLTDVAADERPAAGDGVRPGLERVLGRLESGQATSLVVARLAHVAGGAEDLGRLLERVDEHGATLVVCDIGLDTSTAAGRRTATALAAIGGDPGVLATAGSPAPAAAGR
jgi:peptidoglycan hydrolase-like protein with peptidoglycan-binding domain